MCSVRLVGRGWSARLLDCIIMTSSSSFPSTVYRWLSVLFGRCPIVCFVALWIYPVVPYTWFPVTVAVLVLLVPNQESFVEFCRCFSRNAWRFRRWIIHYDVWWWDLWMLDLLKTKISMVRRTLVLVTDQLTGFCLMYPVDKIVSVLMFVW